MAQTIIPVGNRFIVYNATTKEIYVDDDTILNSDSPKRVVSKYEVETGTYDEIEDFIQQNQLVAEI